MTDTDAGRAGGGAVAGLAQGYERDGFVFLPSLLPVGLLRRLRGELPRVLAEDGPQRFYEDDGRTVRAVYGLHRKDGPWREAAENSVLTAVARLLLDEDMYVFQWKLNPKAARTGDRWQWHRDFDFWRERDGMARPDVLTAALFLDDVTYENGPLRLVPGSHAVTSEQERRLATTGQGAGREPADGRGWSGMVSARLTYALPEGARAQVTDARGTFTATGPAGSVVLFHGNIVHGSSPNTSAATRNLALITYNTIRNAPAHGPGSRPEFFCNRVPAPLPDLRDMHGFAAR
ncbi:phytanoyl-CoA dioxygenase family protein [Streptomyces sp. NPDC059009]|uniref:phytanoyl-CoA dioxygenase family protein n=1 Tax=Streptomyces sp. NPDC059009 TaxID=3346694 RepID=UPI0036B98FA9